MWIAILLAIAIICFFAGVLPKKSVMPDETTMDGHDPCDPDMD